jgi:DNA-binding PadR family transcriptional regulator
MAKRLNTTDFAILGLLARRPWSAYELTQYMCNSNIRAVWPRAESRIYASPKKLAEFGFASTQTEEQGKRSRVVYHITPEGEDALEIWLARESRPFGFEYETLLKLALGDIGDPEHRTTQLGNLAEEAARDSAEMSGWMKMFSVDDEEEISSDRRVQNLLINSFIKELLDARLRWSELAAEIDEQFGRCETEEDKAAMVREFYRRML